jgi:hypothetical protein
MINRAFVAVLALFSLTLSAGCATTVRTPFGTYYEYNGHSTYNPAPERPAYHHSESGPGYYCRVYSTGSGEQMRFTRECYPNR